MIFNVTYWSGTPGILFIQGFVKNGQLVKRMKVETNTHTHTQHDLKCFLSLFLNSEIMRKMNFRPTWHKLISQANHNQFQPHSIPTIRTHHVSLK